MLWLCLSLPRLSLDARADSNPAATLQGLAAWAYQYTDRLSVVCRSAADGPGGEPFHALLAEIQGSVKLFGGLPALRERLLGSFAAFDHPHHCAIAPTPAAAELFARAQDDRPVLSLEELPARLAPLPLAALDLPHAVLVALRGVGLSTVGDVLALPPGQVGHRFGTAAAKYLRRLTGEASDPRPIFVLPPGWRRRCELNHPVESLESLGFVMNRLLLELEGVLIARDNAATSLTLTLDHEDAAPSVIPVALTAPGRDAQAWLPLLRERLARTPMPPITALTLEVTQFADNPYGQHDLFDDRVKRESATRQLIERLAARLGERAVRGIALREDHRPEMSFMSCPYQWSAVPAAARPPRRLGVPKPAESPFWLLRKPRPLRAAPVGLGKPQRIESGWWDGAGIARDYYVAEGAGGERLWVYREKEQWFLHGLWA